MKLISIVIICTVFFVSCSTEKESMDYETKLEEIKKLVEKYDLPDSIIQTENRKAIEEIDIQQLDTELAKWSALKKDLQKRNVSPEQRALSKELRQKLDNAKTQEEIRALLANEKYSVLFPKKVNN